MSSQKLVHFETTNWTELSQLNGPEADTALAGLCQKYWEPLYAFARKRTNDVHRAQDLTQGFFQHILSKSTLQQADRDRGRFRTFLLAAFKNFVSNENARLAAKRRGGDVGHVPLDFTEAERTFLQARLDRATPEQQFERAWTLKLIHNVMESLRIEYQKREQADRFALLEPFLISDSNDSRSDAAEALSLSPEAFRKAVSRLRKQFRELLKAEVGQLVHDSADVDDEIRQMFQSLSD